MDLWKASSSNSSVFRFRPLPGRMPWCHGPPPSWTSPSPNVLGGAALLHKGARQHVHLRRVARSPAPHKTAPRVESAHVSDMSNSRCGGVCCSGMYMLHCYTVTHTHIYIIYNNIYVHDLNHIYSYMCNIYIYIQYYTILFLHLGQQTNI